MGFGDDAPNTSEDQDHSETSDPASGRDTPDDPPATLDQRLDRYRAAATAVVDLAGRYEATGLGHVELVAWAVRERSLRDPFLNDVPIFTQMIRAPRLEVFIAINHTLFMEYGVEIRDLAMVEVA